MVMRRKKEFTAEQIEWFKENFPTGNINVVRAKMGVTIGRLYELAEEWGVERKKERKGKYLPAGHKRLLYFDPDAPGNYCINCDRYIPGGVCRKTGKEVGGLWQKRCFTGEE